MKLFQRMFFAAVLAGLAAGLAMAAIQQWKVAPLIVAAELYEAQPVHDHATAAPQEHAPEAWAPADGAERIAYTAAAFLAVAGFRSWTAIVAAAVLILLPHLIGAPVAPDRPSTVPAHLASQFAAAALAAGAVFWLTLGPLLGYLNERFAERVAHRSAHA